jgi:hypothetical protein
MIEFRPKLWRGLGAAVLIAASGTLTACGGEGGESAAVGEAGEAAGGEAGEAAIGETGGEGGEAGAEAVYGGLDAGARTALRLHHLKGFLLVAQKELQAGRAAEAGALVGQGALEVHTPAPGDFAGLDIALVTAASDALMNGAPNGEAALARAIAAIEAEQSAASPETVRRMLQVMNGIYAVVNSPAGVDPIEYQHAYGAALSAADALRRAGDDLRAANAARVAEAQTEMDRLLALFAGSVAPETPAPAAQLAAQSSRVELALSGL